MDLPKLVAGAIAGIVWTLSGPDDPTGVAEFEVELIDQEGETIGGYRSMPYPRSRSTSSTPWTRSPRSNHSAS